jgi:TP901-1 family phage major tail protein
MPSQKGRDFLFKIGDDGDPESFTSLGAARTNGMALNNNPVDSTTVDDEGVQTLIGDAGVQTMEVAIDGLFKDADAEETLRSVAFSGATKNFQLSFPNGDLYEAAFVIKEYKRSGTHDGLETFSAVLVRNGAGTYTTAA